MKTICRYLVLCGVTLCCLAAPLWAQPALMITDTVYDAGVLVQGVPVEHAFVLQNTGDEVLKFKPEPC